MRPLLSAPERLSRGHSGQSSSQPAPGSVGSVEPVGAILESPSDHEVVTHPTQPKQLEIDLETHEPAHLSHPLAAEWVADVEREAAALCARREYTRALGLVQEVLASDAPAAGPLETLREILWISVTGEIGRLVGEALEAGSEGLDALATLARAEAVAREVSGEVLGAGRQEDLNRRLWWGYTKLGAQRAEAGDFESALQALSHALRLASGDPERQGQTRRSLSRALDGAADRAEEDVKRFLEKGDRSAAEACGSAMSEAVDRALADGLAPEEVVGVIAKRRDLMLRIAEERPA